MAVETKQGNTTANGTEQPMLASGSSPNVAKRAPRTSALMKAASALPTVERSLEAFIAKANETLVDVGNWGAEEQAAKEAEERRREQDAQRWKQAEQQMRESEQREQAMRRQLDGLQGKLAEAEARAAVAGALSGSSANDAALAELKKQIEEATERMRAAEEKSQQVQRELASAKLTGAIPAVVPLEISGGTEERVRLAEAKAAKAIAAARAAQAGLTVSSADLAAIESGLVVPMAPQKRSPWLAVTLAFVGGLGIMFVVWKFALSKDDATTPAPQAAVAQPVAAPSDTPPAAKPSVKPIDEDQVAAPSEPPVSGQTVKVIPIEEPGAAPAPTPAAVPAPAPAAVEEPKSEPKAVAKRAKKPSRAKKTATTTASSSKTKFADPFADDTAKPEKAAKTEKKGEKLVDPF